MKNIKYYPEQRVIKEIDLNNTQYVSMGIDIGFVSSQGVLMADNNIYAYVNTKDNAIKAKSADRIISLLLETANIHEKRINSIVGTGSGRVNIHMADRKVTEIACHARGASYIYGKGVRTILDVGGQDIKVIRCDGQGKVTNFLINDKCAAGTGLGCEFIAEQLNLSLDEMGDYTTQGNNSTILAFSSSCVFYVQKEILCFLRNGMSTAEIWNAYSKFTAEHICAVIQRAGLEPMFAITGGIGKNKLVMQWVLHNLNLPSMTKLSWDPQLAGAIGAALYGQALCKKGKARFHRSTEF